MTSHRCAYADGLALLNASRDWKAVEDTKPSHDYTVSLSADLEVEAQQYENGDGGLSS